ncbi:MAG: carbonic anhydrase [Legionellaceae bacterium]|nr:carbonic anhydrase [Legionellaceae bacterium]
MCYKTIPALTYILCCLWATAGLAKQNEPSYPLPAKTMSQAKQQDLTPQRALQRLKDGNKRFLTNQVLQRDYLAQAKESAYGQFPFAVILNCMDSRSVPEFFFDQGLADLFTLRVAGNVVNDDILGSMEFATKAAGARLIVVLAHTSCGAVVGACQDVQLGHLTQVLDKIEPFVKPAMEAEKTKDCSKPVLIDAIAKANAQSAAQQIKAQSPIIKALIDSGKVGIVAGVHDIRTGHVRFFEEKELMVEE